MLLMLREYVPEKKVEIMNVAPNQIEKAISNALDKFYGYRAGKPTALAVG